MRGKLFTLLALSLAASLSAYASDDNPNNIPEDNLENFYRRYRNFVEDKEYKPMKPLFKEIEKINKKYGKNLKGLENRIKELDGKPDRQSQLAEAKDRRNAVLADMNREKETFLTQLKVLVDAFWHSKDSDPGTPENDYKKIVDERIDDIAAERFFGDPATPGLMFRNNGGFFGDMAKVYMIHGEPTAYSVLSASSYITDLMLWLYVDGEGDSGFVRYAFLFYKPSNSGEFKMFNQNMYQLDPCQALNEILIYREAGYQAGQQCPPHYQNIFRDLQMATASDGTPGFYYAWALLNFSQDPSVKQGHAMKPPLAANVVAAHSGSRVVGEAPKPKEGEVPADVIPASCGACKSMIPGNLIMPALTLEVRRNSLDWVNKGEKIEAELKLRFVLEPLAGKDEIVFEKTVRVKSTRELFDTLPEGEVSILFLTDEEVKTIPAGIYRASLYVKNLQTYKYGAWYGFFVKE